MTAIACCWCGTSAVTVQGPGVAICGPCLGQCLVAPEAPQPHGSTCRCPACCCSWCGTTAHHQRLVAGGEHAIWGTARICTGCLELCAITLDEQEET